MGCIFPGSPSLGGILYKRLHRTLARRGIGFVRIDRVTTLMNYTWIVGQPCFLSSGLRERQTNTDRDTQTGGGADISNNLDLETGCSFIFLFSFVGYSAVHDIQMSKPIT